MAAKENIPEYYQRYSESKPPAGQVAVYRLKEFAGTETYPHVRRDFYKIKLMRQVQGVLSYADQRVSVQDSTLVMVNPLIPHSWERHGGSPTGYACLFTEEFVTQQLKTASVAGSPLFRVGAAPVLFPPPETVEKIAGVFEDMLAEMQSDYANKYDLLRSYVQIILHEAQKLAPAAPHHPPANSAARLSAAFLALLDGSFPIATPQHTLPLRNANEFARQLAVHTNHLNKALKETTGKTTTEHIAEKLLAEAKALLRHSNWSMAEISYCLGFEHASNFNSFFRKHAGCPPSQYRRQVVVHS
ncbi:helix-turn-helix domain-containing protein [Hymenobacter monticola]|uniref:Helix-turn-helix transcriptional regulator n=1 Tax=Hymenobacter monticola TaxID=1705399 RepID=A0ABY4B0M8_9BACT|nr:helix-turn-helix transcriptional regulator [Hymenobacter monticola]UOE32674.1 helix-turn-helix transcriptional regulator [Hymenobacter monticola]